MAWAREGGAFDLTVSLPFNTRAEIRVKAAYAREGATLYLDGVPIQALLDGDWWTYDAGCGAYHFRLE